MACVAFPTVHEVATTYVIPVHDRYKAIPFGSIGPHEMSMITVVKNFLDDVLSKFPIVLFGRPVLNVLRCAKLLDHHMEDDPDFAKCIDCIDERISMVMTQSTYDLFIKSYVHEHYEMTLHEHMPQESTESTGSIHAVSVRVQSQRIFMTIYVTDDIRKISVQDAKFTSDSFVVWHECHSTCPLFMKFQSMDMTDVQVIQKYVFSTRTRFAIDGLIDATLAGKTAMLTSFIDTAAITDMMKRPCGMTTILCA
jgi:hypothetical protein